MRDVIIKSPVLLFETSKHQFCDSGIMVNKSTGQTTTWHVTDGVIYVASDEWEGLWAASVEAQEMYAIYVGRIVGE